VTVIDAGITGNKLRIPLYDELLTMRIDEDKLPVLKGLHLLPVGFDQWLHLFPDP
jgi:hypothetical protein